MIAVLVEPPSVDAAAPRRAAVALARVEAGRMLRHPVTVAATFVLVAVWVTTFVTLANGRYPVLQELDRDSAIGTMVLLGGATLVVANLAVLRGQRDGTAALSQVLVLPPAVRTGAHLLAVVPMAGLAAVLVLARVAFVVVATTPAGRPNPYELAAGPAGVLLFGALGVLLARLTRSVIVAPLALLFVLASLVALQPLTDGGAAMWLAPQGGPALSTPVPVSVLGRPAGAHLAYLVGLAALLAVAALVRAGARGVRVSVAAVVAVGCAVTGGATQLSTPDPAVVAARAEAMNHPSRYQTCRDIGSVTYCAYDGFDGWIPAWDEVVRGVLAGVPDTARSARVTVRQRFAIVGLAQGRGPQPLLDAWRADDTAAGTPGSVGVDTQWGDSGSVASLAARFAFRLLTGEAPVAQVEQNIDLAGTRACGGVGVLVIWLAGQSGGKAETGLREIVGDDGPGGILFGENPLFPGVYVPAPEFAVAKDALARPRADIAARVERSWAALTAPGTTAEQAAQLLGVPAPPAGVPCS